MDELDLLMEMMGDNPLDGIVPIEEAYRGKTKELLELEKMVGESRKKYYGTFKIGGNYYTDKNFVKIGDKIADIFGFKVCDFNLVNDPAPNAFTVPCGYSMTYYGKMRPHLINNRKEAMKFKRNELSAFIRVTSGMWTNETFTDGEVTAIIVHEVGHNFQQEVNNGIWQYMLCMYFLLWFQYIAMICNPATTVNGIISLIKNDSELRGEMNRFAKNSNIGELINAGGTIVGFCKMIMYNVLEIAGRMSLGIPAGLINMSSLIIQGIASPLSLIIGLVVAPIGKSQENISDYFAAEHGYGPELISILSKIDVDPDADPSAVGRICKKLPVFDCICTLFALPTMIIANFFSDHPVTGKRAANIVWELQKELDKTDMTPKMRKEVEAQIKEVKDAVEKYGEVQTPMEGTAMRKAILRFTANFDRDPKGFMQRIYSKRDLIESVIEQTELDDIAEFTDDYLDLL